MILLTELSTRTIAPLFISDGQGVWRFSFAGDATYTDDQGADFYWSGRATIYNVRGVTLSTIAYREVQSVADCRTLEQSWYWDNPNKRLYVHHDENINDYVLERDLYVYLASEVGYATGRFVDQKSYYPDLFFDPIIKTIGGLNKTLDPLKFGLMTFESSNVSLINAQAEFDNYSLEHAYNSAVIFVLMKEGQADINDGQRLFTGYSGGARYDDSSLALSLEEARLFFDRNACPSVFTTDDYVDLDPKFENKRVPVAYGDIRRGICVPIDSDGVETGDAATITFKLADESIHAIRAVDALYDSNGDSVTLGTINLTQCTVQYSKAAGKEVDLGKFRWRGEGYDIPGTYTNGLDIIRDAMAEQGETPYNDSFYDMLVWDAEIIANNQKLGLSVQSDKGIVEAIVQPITVSLQGVIDVLGDGRLTFLNRNPSGPISRLIEQYQIIEKLKFSIDPEAVVSSIVINYAPDFIEPANALSAVYDDDETEVISKYGIQKTEPLSPIETVLTTEADALALGAEVAATSTDPERIVEIAIPLDDRETQILEIVQVDVGRPHAADWQVFEVLGRGLVFNGNQLSWTFRLRHLPDRVAQFPLPLTTEGYADLLTETDEAILTEG